MILVTVSGIVAALVLALLVAAAVGSRRFGNRYEKEKADLIERASALPASAPAIAAAADLPLPVQKYLQVTRSLQKPGLKIAILMQRGTLRAAADKPWMPFQAEQVYSIDPPAFVWLANARFAPLVRLLARDKFVGGKGNMLITLLGLFVIADARGPQIDLGAGLRYWGEIVAFPEAIRSQYLRWEPVNEQRARLTIEQGSLKMSAVIEFNGDGFPIGVHTDRYRDVKGKPVLTRWSGYSRDWKLVDGRLFPTSWESVWHLTEGDFTAVRMEILAVQAD